MHIVDAKVEDLDLATHGMDDGISHKERAGIDAEDDMFFYQFVKHCTVWSMSVSLSLRRESSTTTFLWSVKTSLG